MARLTFEVSRTPSAQIANVSTPGLLFPQTFSGRYVPIWISYPEGPDRLEDLLRARGILLADVPIILPLKYDIYEVLVDETKVNALPKKSHGLAMDPFDKKCPLVHIHGKHGALRILLDAYKQTNYWEGMKELVQNRTKELEMDVVHQTEFGIYGGGPGKILEYVCGWDQAHGDYRVLAVFQTPDGKKLRAWMSSDTYAKSEDAKVLAGPEWAVIIRHVSWGTWLQLPFVGIIHAMGLY